MYNNFTHLVIWQAIVGLLFRCCMSLYLLAVYKYLPIEKNPRAPAEH